MGRFKDHLKIYLTTFIVLRDVIQKITHEKIIHFISCFYVAFCKFF